MTSSGRSGGALALIIAIIAAGMGGFLIINTFFLHLGSPQIYTAYNEEEITLPTTNGVYEEVISVNVNLIGAKDVLLIFNCKVYLTRSSGSVNLRGHFAIDGNSLGSYPYELLVVSGLPCSTTVALQTTVNIPSGAHKISVRLNAEYSTTNYAQLRHITAIVL